MNLRRCRRHGSDTVEEHSPARFPLLHPGSSVRLPDKFPSDRSAKTRHLAHETRTVSAAVPAVVVPGSVGAIGGSVRD